MTPLIMSLEPSGYSRTSKTQMVKSSATKQDWLHKATPKSKESTTVKPMPPLLDLNPFAYTLSMHPLIKLLYIKWMLKVLF